MDECFSGFTCTVYERVDMYVSGAAAAGSVWLWVRAKQDNTPHLVRVRVLYYSVRRWMTSSGTHRRAGDDMEDRGAPRERHPIDHITLPQP